MSVFRLLVAICLTAVLSVSLFAAEEAGDAWSGKLQDAALRELAPKAGFIADAETWKMLWTAWRPDEELPAVDFAKELVMVGTVPGPNLVIMRPVVEEGNVKFVVGGTKIGGPGFGYKLVKIAREGIETVNGKPIAAKGVQGKLVIPKTVGSFAGHTLEIKLFEFDPFLADVSAKLVDQFDAKEFGHTAGETTELEFTVGGKLEPRQDRSYYITVFVLKDGQRTHMGELDGKPGLCKVLTEGNPSEVKMIVRAVR
ncbi:hypothetical protein LOC68_07115 [Blastopirellula sp. JC732]|uniref:Uncharacterized protein n=1 Tax=Blastopirellula sediminis TaxID=2894196 RepID=A0A9X1MKZ6_9BACT|nr:hypothetical protein [Blastopirellula sediminis]MCC9609063.1 hypothetical protein [Blastopirellula sediminis]MCC9628160.1 hypothetical protein [Blastopirellula sediminis]